MTKTEFYALLCFLTITDNWKDKHPDYLFEKADMLGAGMHAFGYLDFKNMRKLVGWMKESNMTVPPEWQQELDAQLQAWRELRQQGIEL